MLLRPYTLREVSRRASSDVLIGAIHFSRMLSASDADNIKVPLGLFPSKDEPLDEVKWTRRHVELAVNQDIVL